jgi:hypothetical protein
LLEKLGGMRRSSFSVGEMSAINIATAKAEYKDEEFDRRISFEIIDGAGEAASSMISILILTFQSDMDSKYKDGFEKTVDLYGDRTLVKETKYKNIISSEIQWIHKNRYIMKLKGNSVSFDELSDLKNKLDLGSLK